MTRLTFAFALVSAMAVVPATAFAMGPYLPRTPQSFTRVDVDANGKITAAELTPRVEKRFDQDGCRQQRRRHHRRDQRCPAEGAGAPPRRASWPISTPTRTAASPRPSSMPRWTG